MNLGSGGGPDAAEPAPCTSRRNSGGGCLKARSGKSLGSESGNVSRGAPFPPPTLDDASDGKGGGGFLYPTTLGFGGAFLEGPGGGGGGAMLSAFADDGAAEPAPPDVPSNQVV